MSWLSFVKVAVSTVAKAAQTVSSVCQAIEPVVSNLPGSIVIGMRDDKLTVIEPNSNDCITVGLVTFEDSNALLTESLNLKRLETFLTFLGNQEPYLKKDLDKDKTANQVIWLHNVTTLLTEVAYQQQILLTTKPREADNLINSTQQFHSFSRMYGGYANDLANTVADLGVIAVFQRSGSQQEYTSSVLGRTDTWEFTEISIDDDNIKKFIKSWNMYFKSTTKGAFGAGVRELAKKEP